VGAAGSVTRRQLLAGAAMTLALAACGGTAAPATSAGKPSIGTLKVASTSAAGTQTPLWLAETLGLWEKHGLTVQRTQVTSDVGGKTLLAREIDVLIQSPPAVITANLNGGADMVYIGSLFNHSQFALAVDPAIQSGAALKGKLLGTDLPGSTGEFQTRVLLSKLGLQPSDVELVKLDPTRGILAALVAGKIQAGTLGVPQPFQAEAKGFRVLANTFDIAYQNIGPVVLRSRLDELSARLQPLLLGIQDGIRAYYAQPDQARQVMAKNTQESDEAVLQRTYDFYAKDTRFQEDLQPTVEGFQSIIDFAASTTLPAAKSAKPDQFIDRRVLDQLPKA
jgi:ABC-type nitrate/sulfonate/bicarbonate transport system substrate-binding protein